MTGLPEYVSQVLTNNKDIVESDKPGKIEMLVGKVIKKCEGDYHPTSVRNEIEKQL